MQGSSDQGGAVATDCAIAWPGARPEALNPVVLAQVCGAYLQDGFGPFSQPELLGAFHAAVELFDD